MAQDRYMVDNLGTGSGSLYPLTKMNFIVTVGSSTTAHKAAFSEITGIEATVDVIEFRQGNSENLSPLKIPGLVKHGNVTMKFGYTLGNGFKDWINKCVSSQRDGLDRADVTIELVDIMTKASPTVIDTSAAGTHTWILKNAWVTKYVAPDLNAMQSEVAIESVEIAYETLVLPTVTGANG